MESQSVYKQLAEAIGASDSLIIPEIFHELIGEKEARVLLAASPPATIEEISAKSGIPKEEIEGMIEPLFKKGLIFTSVKEGQTRYYRVRTVPQFHDATAVAPDASKELLGLWRKYMDTEWSEYSRKIEALLPQPVVRVLPVNVSVEHTTQILAFEDVRSIVESARNLAVTKCSCRVITGAPCGKPIDVCIQVNRAADYAIQRGTGRRLTKEEAVEMLKMCEEEGLVHVADNRQEVGHIICNCCEDCCLNWPSLRTGLKKWVVPSRFEARVDDDLCSGCELCTDRCYFDALKMDRKRGIAAIDPERCMGCGLCMVICPTGAISLKDVRPVSFIPQ